MRKLAVRVSLFALALVALAGWSGAAEPAKKPKDEGAKPPAKAEAAKAAEPAKKAVDEGADDVVGSQDDPVAKVDHTTVTRGELLRARQLMATSQRGPLPNNQQILEQLINRVLWVRHFDKQNLRPTGAQIQRAIKQLDANLRQRGLSYQRFLAARGMSAELHVGMLSYDLAMRRLVNQIAEKVTDKEIKAEYDAHPDWYDGSRIRISQIFIDTSNLGGDKKKLDDAKDRVEKLHAQIEGGKDFDRLARDFSEGAASAKGGERGWFRRKGPEVDEPLIDAAWMLKVGEITKPIRGVRGWHVLKVAAREPAYLTFQGCKANIRQEITRRRLEAVLDDLKAAAKIERLL